MFIRTKDGIYKLKDNGKYGDLIKTIGLDNFHSQNYKQADTIEELCDEFVYQTGGTITKGKPLISKNDFLSLKEWYVSGGINQNNIYGAIWTDKGLIYVAKMNEDGNLELL